MKDMADPIKDQFDAAARDAVNRLVRVGENNNEYEVKRFGPVARAIVLHWFDNAGEEPAEQAMCPHVAPAPQVVYAAAAFPGVCVCAVCFADMWRAYTSMLIDLGRGRPCDGCHSFVDEGKTGVVSVGPMLMTISMCVVCCAIEDAGTPQ